MPALPQLRPLPSLRNVNPSIDAYSGYSSIVPPSKPVASKQSAQEYRTLLFKPWSGVTVKNECEYNVVKEENQPEELIREEENE